MFRMTASQSREKASKVHDAFKAGALIEKAVAEKGAANVATATVGIITDDEGRFCTIPTFERIYRELPAEELCNYSTIAGLADYREAAVKSALAGQLPKGALIEAAATPGGTGAIHSAIFNYVEQGQNYLGPNWYWGNYETMGLEQGSEYETYEMFDEDFSRFNLEAWREKTMEMLSRQDSLLTIYNFPANNPTGYSLTDDEWQEIADTYREICRDTRKRIILVWDWAYCDYAGSPEETRAFLRFFDDMPENMLILVAYSMSKSFMIYGMRSGALIAVTTSQDVIDDFRGVTAFTGRNTWSNGSRGAQKALATIYSNPELVRAVDEERAAYREMLLKRGRLFSEEAAEAGLKIIPYGGGFFITVLCDDEESASAAIQQLQDQDIFVLSAGNNGIRVAISSCPIGMVRGLAAKIKAAID